MSEVNPVRKPDDSVSDSKPRKSSGFPQSNHSVQQLSFSYEVNIQRDKCKSCGLCVFYCPTSHLEISKDLNRKGLRYAQIKESTKCIGCGFCFLICPDSCIEVIEIESSNQKPVT